jgi:hypothetical protein
MQEYMNGCVVAGEWWVVTGDRARASMVIARLTSNFHFHWRSSFMSRRIMAAAAAAAVLTLGACSRGDNATYDTAAGMTAGAMATPPAVGLSVGATTGMTTGATTLTRDTLTDTLRRNP